MEGIHTQTGLPLDQQELFFENLPFQPGEPMLASNLPSTTADRPITVFGGTSKKALDLYSPPMRELHVSHADTNNLGVCVLIELSRWCTTSIQMLCLCGEHNYLIHQFSCIMNIMIANIICPPLPYIQRLRSQPLRDWRWKLTSGLPKSAPRSSTTLNTMWNSWKESIDSCISRLYVTGEIIMLQSIQAMTCASVLC